MSYDTITAALRSRIVERRQQLEQQVRDDETIYNRIKDISSMDELADLIASTEKRISYMQARLEENDFFMMEVLGGDDLELDSPLDSTKMLALFKGDVTAEPEAETGGDSEAGEKLAQPQPDITIPKAGEPSYIARYDTGVVSIAGTVKNYVDKMKKGDQIRPHAFGTSLVQMGLIADTQVPHIRTVFRNNPSLTVVERGLYERV